MSDPARPHDERLREALERFGGLLERTVRRLCPRDLGVDPQDLAQEARVRLWRFLERATTNELNPSYVYKVAASVAIDATRAAVARREERMTTMQQASGEPGERSFDPPADRRSSPELELHRRELAALIETALGELSAARQRAVRLHLMGFSSLEICRLTGWSPTKTRSLISRGLRELRHRLAALGVEVHAGS